MVVDVLYDGIWQKEPSGEMVIVRPLRHTFWLGGNYLMLIPRLTNSRTLVDEMSL